MIPPQYYNYNPYVLYNAHYTQKQPWWRRPGNTPNQRRDELLNFFLGGRLEQYRQHATEGNLMVGPWANPEMTIGEWLDYVQVNHVQNEETFRQNVLHGSAYAPPTLTNPNTGFFSLFEYPPNQYHTRVAGPECYDTYDEGVCMHWGSRLSSQDDPPQWFAGGVDSYCQVQLTRHWKKVEQEGRDMRAYLHRMVCYAQMGPPPTQYTLAVHSCGNKSCVNPHHIHWASQKENKYMGGNINKWLILDGQQVRVTCHPQVLKRRKQYLGYLVPN